MARFASLPEALRLMLWIIAALTMTVGNVLAILQNSVKRILAYSSIAHSGYMLVGVIAGPGAPGSAEELCESVTEPAVAWAMPASVANTKRRDCRMDLDRMEYLKVISGSVAATLVK